MLEARRSPTMAGALGGNKYVNGAALIRHPAVVSEVDKFCNALGGKKPIYSILIANNGMTAINSALLLHMMLLD